MHSKAERLRDRHLASKVKGDTLSFTATADGGQSIGEGDFGL